jgi:hypothetical protein
MIEGDILHKLIFNYEQHKILPTGMLQAISTNLPVLCCATCYSWYCWYFPVLVLSLYCCLRAFPWEVCTISSPDFYWSLFKGSISCPISARKLVLSLYCCLRAFPWEVGVLYHFFTRLLLESVPFKREYLLPHKREKISNR